MGYTIYLVGCILAYLRLAAALSFEDSIFSDKFSNENIIFAIICSWLTFALGILIYFGNKEDKFFKLIIKRHFNH